MKVKTKSSTYTMTCWCERCQRKTRQSIRDLGSWEVQRCNECGTERRYKVRW